uniref:Uncharacterized protein n=1 Tax=Anguilla anguilla TaxID=7936 RepID=A0A0E9S247_ANGAN
MLRLFTRTFEFKKIAQFFALIYRLAKYIHVAFVHLYSSSVNLTL